jgi:hypothetical protein
MLTRRIGLCLAMLGMGLLACQPVLAVGWEEILFVALLLVDRKSVV